MLILPKNLKLEVKTLTNHKSAEKRVGTSAKKNIENASKRSALRKLMKATRTSIETNAENKKEMIDKAIRATDAACSDGIIHKNKASRDKSKLAIALNK